MEYILDIIAMLIAGTALWRTRQAPVVPPDINSDLPVKKSRPTRAERLEKIRLRRAANKAE